jgi:hypothetical protein
MEFEIDYGQRLSLLPDNHQPNKQGFDRDDGASLKNAFKGITEQMAKEGETHLTIGSNIRQMVIDPFSKWSADHRERVNYSQDILKNSLKVYNNKFRLVVRIQKKYFTKCRTFESLKHGKTDEEVLAELSLNDENDANEDDCVTIGSKKYSKSELKELLIHLLTGIPQSQVKVPILGTYERVSTGSQIAAYLQQKLKISNLDQCEQFGTDLIANGYLRKVNTSVGSTIGQSNFVNSGSFNYQWKELAYHIAQLPLRKNEDGSLVEGDYSSGNKVTSYIDDLKSSFEEPSLKKLNKEVKDLDEMYQIEVRKLDKIRCDLEELIVDHLTFMEKCELDRLRALKKVILDFSACISNNITSIKSSIDEILVYEETILPDKDLLFLLQNYRTGPFSPQVVLYDNYYDSHKKQIFGVDLETRCKNDNKTVPIIVSSILSYMDSVYPELPDDDVRTKTWLIPVRLQSTHALRTEIEKVGNEGLIPEFWSQHPPEVIASVLKIYLLELPDSIVSNSLYDVIKLIYANHGGDDNTEQRIIGISNVLRDLERSQLATLNVVCTHFQRLISILSESTEASSLAASFQDGISQEFSSCILRPKHHTNVTLSDRHTFRFVHDLLTHKKDVMKLVKRSSSLNSPSVENNMIKRKDSTLQSRLQQAVSSGDRKVSKKLKDVEEIKE